MPRARFLFTNSWRGGSMWAGAHGGARTVTGKLLIWLRKLLWWMQPWGSGQDHNCFLLRADPPDHPLREGSHSEDFPKASWPHPSKAWKPQLFQHWEDLRNRIYRRPGSGVHFLTPSSHTCRGWPPAVHWTRAPPLGAVLWDRAALLLGVCLAGWARWRLLSISWRRVAFFINFMSLWGQWHIAVRLRWREGRQGVQQESRTQLSCTSFFRTTRLFKAL